MQKNVSGQKLIVFAFDSTTNLPKSGDAANITAYVSKDYGSVTVLGDTSATEMDATNAKGYYLFDLTQSETNADTLLFSAKSSTSNIVVVGVPAVVFTVPPNFSAHAISSAGGVTLADGVSHGGTLGSSTATLALSRLNVTSQTSNTAGVTLAGNGSGDAVIATGGATGNALELVGGGTSGDGLKVTATSGHGANIVATGTAKDALHLVGAAAASGNAGGHGINAVGGAASTSSGGTAGVGFRVLGGAGAASTNGAGQGMTADGGGTTTVSGNDAVTLTGSGTTGIGLNVQAGTHAVNMQSNTGGSGLLMQGAGSSAGLKAIGGSTGRGAIIQTGGTGDGLLLTGIGSGKHGLNVLAGVGGNGINATGGNASGSTPAGHGLGLTGGDASTTSGGTSGKGLLATGGAGAASTNGAGDGMACVGGGTTTVSGGNGLTLTHTGSVLDLNATTTNALQVDVNTIKTQAVTCSAGVTVNANVGTTQPINFTGTSSSALAKVDVQDFGGSAGTFSSGKPAVTLASTDVTGNVAADVQTIKTQTVTCSAGVTVNVNVGTTQPVNFTGTSSSALVKSDMVDIAGSAVSTSSAQIGVNAVNIAGTAAATELVTAVWDSLISGHTTSGTFGGALNAAGSAGDPWNTSLPGAYASGTAGYILGQQLGAAFTTSTSSAFTTAALANAPSGGSAPTAAQVATAVWTDLLAGSDFSTTSSIGKLLKDDVNATISSRSTYDGSDTSGTTTLLSRLSSARAGYLDNLSGGAVALASGVNVTAFNGHTTVGGVDWYHALWYMSAVCAGGLPSGAGSGTEVWKDFGGTTAVTFTVDADGNRSGSYA